MERTGKIPDFDLEILKCGLEIAQHTDKEISINLSNSSISTEGFLDKLEDVIGIRHRNNLLVEITETQEPSPQHIAHGYMMGRHRKPLLDEDIQAYQYGPIIKSVHNKVRYYGSSPVLKIKGASAWKGQFTTQEYEIIREVVSLYGAHTALTLSAAMHHPSTPWSITREYANGDAPISNDLIGIFYSKLLEEPAHRYL